MLAEDENIPLNDVNTNREIFRMATLRLPSNLAMPDRGVVVTQIVVHIDNASE